MDEKQKKSPCIDICEFSGPKGWCVGCGRSREECQKWKVMKPYALSLLQNELSKRMAKMHK
ncbi:DUF1289 domain-containing protein [Vibrio hepatarius]|nr:DUF1289 domain-containing protein [Vibrio hepatarius]